MYVCMHVCMKGSEPQRNDHWKLHKNGIKIICITLLPKFLKFQLHLKHIKKMYSQV